MSLKDETLRCYFINRPDSPYFESDIFKNVLGYMQTGTNKAKLKQAGKMFLLVVGDVKDMKEMHRFLHRMHKEVLKPEEPVEA
jgi:transcription-repair coupling factor (superfamily II helicase)